MQNHWLKKLRDVRELLDLCCVALWTGTEYVEKKPLSLTLEWDFLKRIHVQAIRILDFKGMYYPLSTLNRTVDKGCTLTVNLRGISINGYPIEELMEEDEE